MIIWSFDENNKELLLHFHDFNTGKIKTKSEKCDNLQVKITNATMYVGSDVYGVNQADAVISKVPSWVITEEGLVVASGGLELSKRLK
jgi:hypothetical protein